MGQTHHGRPPHGVEPVTSVDRLGGSPDPPDVGSVLSVGPVGLHVAVDQGEVIDEFHRRRYR